MREITVEEAIRILKRCDNEFHTPEKRAAHRMAIEAILKVNQMENQKDNTNKAD